MFFIGLGKIHLFDWDEINFAESAREMMQTGDYLRVQINYQPFWEKPPFFFWLQVGSMKLFGINEFAARFPNAVFGFIYLVTFYFIGKKHFSAKFGMMWALLFFGSLLPHLYFKSGIIDPVFNYFIFTSIYFMILTIAKTENATRYALFSGILSGLSLLTKGPVGFLLLGLTLLVYLIIKRFKPFPSMKHILLFFTGFIAMISIWISMEVAQNGWVILEQFIAYQAELFNADVAGHAQPFYYHFVVVGLFCFPISLIALPNILKKIESVYDIHLWFKILFWVVMILFSITTTKIIHYSSMTYVPLAFIATHYLYHLGQDKIKKYVSVALISVSILVGIVFIALPLLLKYNHLITPYINDPFAVESMNVDLGFSGFESLIGVLFIVGSILAIVKLKKGHVISACVRFSTTMSLTLLFALYFIVFNIEKMTQGPAIEFYSTYENKDVFIETLGKSYAPYFYGKIEPSTKIDELKPSWTNDGVFNRNLYLAWLLEGDVDKPVYFAVKCTNRALDEHDNFQLLYSKGGFRFYERVKNRN